MIWMTFVVGFWWVEDGVCKYKHSTSASFASRRLPTYQFSGKGEKVAFKG